MRGWFREVVDGLHRHISGDVDIELLDRTVRLTDPPSAATPRVAHEEVGVWWRILQEAREVLRTEVDMHA